MLDQVIDFAANNVAVEGLLGLLKKLNVFCEFKYGVLK